MHVDVSDSSDARVVQTIFSVVIFLDKMVTDILCVQYNTACIVQYCMYSTVLCDCTTEQYCMYIVQYNTVCIVQVTILCTVQYCVTVLPYNTVCIVQYCMCIVQYCMCSTILCVQYCVYRTGNNTVCTVQVTILCVPYR